jgi:hypothetical protein
MEDTVQDCIEDETEGSTHASNRLYVLNRSLKRADKLELRALIGHLVGYNSTNIFRI